MAYDNELDVQLSKIVGKNNIEIKKMFGGTCYLYKGKMICGVWKENVILKVNEQIAEDAVKNQNAEYFNMTKRLMKSMVMFQKKLISDEFLKKWVKITKEIRDSIEE
jgi:TfoX/Sxy family transcriptional regulator of competence genes